MRSSFPLRNNFTPFPKNPIICNFMLHIGRYEQAGSGVYNVCKYLPYYTPGAMPTFEELHDIFSATIPLPGKDVTPDVTPEVIDLLLVLEGEMSRREIMRRLGLSDEKHFRERYQQQAVKAEVIELTIPEKPTSRLQKYRLTARGRILAERHRKL